MTFSISFVIYYKMHKALILMLLWTASNIFFDGFTRNLDASVTTYEFDKCKWIPGGYRYSDRNRPAVTAARQSLDPPKFTMCLKGI